MSGNHIRIILAISLLKRSYVVCLSWFRHLVTRFIQFSTIGSVTATDLQAILQSQRVLMLERAWWTVPLRNCKLVTDCSLLVRTIALSSVKLGCWCLPPSSLPVFLFWAGSAGAAVLAVGYKCIIYGH